MKKKKVSRYNFGNVRTEVNKFDKQFGIELGNINPLGEPEMVFALAIHSLQDFLIAVLYEINGIDKEIYRNGKNSFKRLTASEFEELSILDWNGDEVYDVSSSMFRCRFLTMFILKLITRLEKIAIHKYDQLSQFKFGKYENGYFYLQRLSRDIRRFVSVIVSGNEFPNILLQVNQSCSYISVKRTDPLEINRYIREIRKELEIGLEKPIFGSRDMPEDIAVDSILKLAYLISSGDSDLQNLPNFRYIEGCDTTYNLRGLIEELGCAILEARRYTKRPLLYQAFMGASPAIYSDYEDINENWYLSIGFRSLEYTKFFCGNKAISRFIDKMIYNNKRKR